jgi:hypothetical protein
VTHLTRITGAHSIALALCLLGAVFAGALAIGVSAAQAA